MVIYHDTTLGSAFREGAGGYATAAERPEVQPAARCAGCGCCLSVYRTKGERVCCACSRATAEHREPINAERYARASAMLAAGSSFAEVARRLGWPHGVAARRALRGYELRHGLPRAQARR